MNNCLDDNNKFKCTGISHLEPVLENINRTGRLTLPIFSSNSGLFVDYGRLWCLNRENQSNCIPDENFMLIPKDDIYPEPSSLNESNNFSYSNNIKDKLINDNILNIGRKFDSTGIDVTKKNTYKEISTENNPYPSNVKFTPDDISLSELNAMNVEKLKYCNNRSIENRFRPVLLHVPEKFLEICEPKGYIKGSDYSKL